MNRICFTARRSGFSLIQLSIILTVGGLLLAASLPGGEAGSESAQARITLERMSAIEDATQAYMAANQRRPYPADLTAGFGTAAFGVELAVPTDYSTVPTTHFASLLWTLSLSTTQGSNKVTVSNNAGTMKNMLISGTGISPFSWVEAIDSSTSFYLNKPASATGSATAYMRSPLVTGGVPTKTLGLPDEYAIDGYGHRIMYMVDSRVATQAGCAALQNDNRKGALALSVGDTFSTGTYDNTMWALMSYGKDAYGAYTMQGTALTTRLKNNNSAGSTATNAFINAATKLNYYYPSGLVTKDVAPFDDIVWVNQTTKNTCALGSTGATLSNSFRDFRISGGGNANSTLAAAAFGDVNGDGIKDIILGVPQQNLVRVIFGKKDGWPDPTNAYDTTTLDGTNGFTIVPGTTNYMTSFGSGITVGDFNGDGIDDILIGGIPPAITDYGDVVVFGRPSFPASVDSTTLTAAQGFRIKGLNTSVTAYASAGDVNGDGFDDITLPYNAASYDTGVATDHYGTLDGVNGSVYSPTINALNTNIFTACVWANFNDVSTTATHQIMGGQTSTTSYTTSFMFNQYGNSLYMYYLSGGPVKTHPGQLTTGGWHHICMVNNAGTAQTYYDGAALSTSYPTTGTIGTGQRVGFGTGGASPNAKIADARIYNVALTASNITSIYTNGSSGTPPSAANLIARWQFNEGTGTVVSDSSGNRLHATLNQTASTFWPAGSFNVAQGLMYGKASGWADVDLVAKYLDGTNGFYFYIPTPDASTGIISYGTADATVFNRQFTAICDVTGDGYGDILFPAVYNTASVTPQRMYLVTGRNTASWTAIMGAGGSIAPGGIGLKYRFYNADTTSPAYNVQGAACKDINSDGYDDILFYLRATSGSQEYIYGYFGRISPGNVSMDTAYDIRWDTLYGSPSGWNSGTPYRFQFGDLNNDGKTDIFVTRGVDWPVVTTTGTTFTVGNTGTQRTNGGVTYVLFQPASCPYTTGTTCWGGSTALAKNFYADYLYDGTGGIKIPGAVTNDNSSVLAVADMNKDGKDDVLLSSGVNPTGAYFLFGKTLWPGSYDPNCTRDNSGAHCPNQMQNK